jgi:phosphonoacetaldehyde hydrolase
MIFRVMEKLNVYPTNAVLKIGDTEPDIGEGCNAGAWSLGVTRTGSEVGCTEAEFAALSEMQQEAKLLVAGRKLLDAGAHAVLESVADLPTWLDELPNVGSTNRR